MKMVVCSWGIDKINRSGILFLIFLHRHSDFIIYVNNQFEHIGKLLWWNRNALWLTLSAAMVWMQHGESPVTVLEEGPANLSVSPEKDSFRLKSKCRLILGPELAESQRTWLKIHTAANVTLSLRPLWPSWQIFTETFPSQAPGWRCERKRSKSVNKQGNDQKSDISVVSVHRFLLRWEPTYRNML